MSNDTVSLSEQVAKMERRVLDLQSVIDAKKALESTIRRRLLEALGNGVSSPLNLGNVVKRACDRLQAGNSAMPPLWVRDGEPDEEIVGLEPGRWFVEAEDLMDPLLGFALPQGTSKRAMAIYAGSDRRSGWSDVFGIDHCHVLATAADRATLERWLKSREEGPKAEAPKPLLHDDCVVASKGGETFAAYVAATFDDHVVVKDEPGEFHVLTRASVALRFRPAGGGQ